MSLFKGFTAADLIERTPTSLIATLANELAITNKSLEALSEEIRNLTLKNGGKSSANISRGVNKKPSRPRKDV